MQAQLGQRLSARLFNEIAKQPLNPAKGKAVAPSWSLRFAFLLAGLVYTIGFSLGIAGVVILLQPWTNLLIVILGITLLLLCWITRSREPGNGLT